MATDAQTLLNEAKCYECFASNPYTLNLLKLALLQQIAAAGGGGTSYFNLVGTAYIGGDQTGNVRGSNALDVQGFRSAASQVASGASSIAFGYGNTASLNAAVAVGYSNTASGVLATAVGSLNTASGTYTSSAFGYKNTASGSSASTAIGSLNVASAQDTLAIGSQNTASAIGAVAVGLLNTVSATQGFAFGIGNTVSADHATAIGYNARARVAYTTNLGSPIINRKDDGETLALAFESFCGANVVLMWPEADLESVADYVITLPAGCHFYPDECGVIVTSANTVTVQPTVRFGNSGTPAKFLAAAITTTAAAQFDRQRFQTLLSAAGEVTLSAGVTVVATATTMLGRFYMKGLLVEDE